MFFIRTSPVLVFSMLLAYSLHACMLAYSLHACMLIIRLAYFDTCILCTWMLSLFQCVCVCKCKCRSVSVEVSVFKGFSGRTLRNAFGKKMFCKQQLGQNKASRMKVNSFFAQAVLQVPLVFKLSNHYLLASKYGANPKSKIMLRITVSTDTPYCEVDFAG